MARKKRQDLEASSFTSEAVEAIAGLSRSKQLNSAAKAEKKAAKKAKKDSKKATSRVNSTAADDTTERASHTAQRTRNALNAAKVIVPALTPLLAPLAVRLAGAGREAYDRYRARKLGINIDSLAEYSGKGATLQARMAGLADGLGELRGSRDAAAAEFLEQATPTLRQLSAVVRAAEHMPAARRKEAYRAVQSELDILEQRLLHHLGL